MLNSRNGCKSFQEIHFANWKLICDFGIIDNLNPATDICMHKMKLMHISICSEHVTLSIVIMACLDIQPRGFVDIAWTLWII